VKNVHAYFLKGESLCLCSYGFLCCHIILCLHSITYNKPLSHGHGSYGVSFVVVDLKPKSKASGVVVIFITEGKPVLGYL